MQPDSRDTNRNHSDPEREKLLLEVKELRESPKRFRQQTHVGYATAIVSALTTILVASFGGYLSYQASQSQGSQHRDDLYEKLVSNLGSENGPTRAGAIAGLQQFVDNPTDERARQTIAILATQLSKEKDEVVLHILIPSLVHLGSRVIYQIIEQNLDARHQFTSLIRSIVRTRAKSARNYLKLPFAARAKVILDEQVDIMDESLSSLEKEVDTDLPANPDLNNFPDGPRLIMAPNGSRRLHFNWVGDSSTLGTFLYRMAFGETQLEAIESEMISQYGRFDVGDRSDMPTDVDIALSKAATEVRILYLTSEVIDSIIRTTSVRASLNGVALYAVSWPGLNLDNIDLSGAIISGNAKGATFRSADLASADLQHLQIDQANFALANLNRTDLPTISNAQFDNANLIGPIQAKQNKHLLLDQFYYINTPHQPVAGDVNTCNGRSKHESEITADYIKYENHSRRTLKTNIQVVSFCEVIDWALDREAEVSQHIERFKSTARTAR
jgi:uncharacterized protein YjbI with pentapeptide repeats